MGMSPAAQRADCDDRDEFPPLTREVLSPREALCDSCLGAERSRRHGAIVRAVWVSTVILVFAHALEALPW